MQNSNLHLFNLIKDLLFHPNVSYLHTFRIASPTSSIISLDILTFALLTAFISPAIPYYDSLNSHLNLGAFVLKAKYSSFEGKEVTGLVFLLVFQRLDYFYFFLFRCNLHISAFQSDAFFTNVAQSNLYMIDFFLFNSFVI